MKNIQKFKKTHLRQKLVFSVLLKTSKTTRAVSKRTVDKCKC